MKIILLIVFTSVTSFGQYIENYYPLINEAELAIVDSNYQQAYTLYRKAFAAVESPRSVDYENAAKCAFLTFDDAGGKFYLLKLAGRGYTENYLKTDLQHLLFRGAFEDSFFAEEMKLRYKSFIDKQKQEMEKDSTTTTLLGKLWKKNQLENATKNSAELTILNKEFADYLESKWKASFGFSSHLESYLLTNLLQDSTIHFSVKKLDKTLITAIDAGHLPPSEVYEILSIRQYGFLKQSERLLMKVSVNVYVCEDKETIEPVLDKWLTDKQLIEGSIASEINKIRKSIGYESLENELKKRVHSMRCNDECNFDLRCPRQYTYYPTTCEETKKLLIGMEAFGIKKPIPTKR